MQNKLNIQIGIIGFGRFGVLIASVLKKSANVKVYHYKESDEILEKTKIIGVELADFKTVAGSDIVIIATPISKTEKIIKQAAKYVKDGALVIDVCSVKIYPCKWLKKYIPKTVGIMGTHPMFGSITTNFDLKKQKWDLRNKQIVLCPLRIKKKNLRKVKIFLTDLGLKVIETLPKNHDKQNAVTLSLVHFLGRSLWQAGIRNQEIYTPGFSDLLKIYRHTTGDSWDLFYDMNNYNPYAKKIREKFFSGCDFIEEKIEKAAAPNDFQFVRNMIDNIDDKIIKLMNERFKYVDQMGKIKKKIGMRVIDKKREDEIIKGKITQSNFSPNFIKKLYKLIFSEAYKKEA
ncbi:MAG: prephenate dehydrogenase/arogenate dehydrogenase family protein [Patescibacteria group bacterium]|nr:prephenate dehydrogenase/arogenate dehydrogenase family protein [Patescibacteria group bacterium]